MMEEIIKNLEEDRGNFKVFMNGARDSYLYCKEEEITSKEFDDFVKIIDLFYPFRKMLSSFTMGKNFLFITTNENKDKLIRKEYFGKKITEKNLIKIFGFLLDIPSCCTKKYAEEFEMVNTGGFEGGISARRYLKQVKELKVKDRFLVSINKNHLGYSLFIPCHPRCPNALKVVKKIDEKIK